MAKIYILNFLGYYKIEIFSWNVWEIRPERQNQIVYYYTKEDAVEKMVVKLMWLENERPFNEQN